MKYTFKKMKRIHLKLIYLLILTSSTSYGQNYGVLKANLLGPFRGLYDVAYEHSLGKVFSAQLTYEWGKYGGAEANGNEYYKATGYGIIPEVRLYPFRATKPWMVQPFMGADFRYMRFVEVNESSPSFAYMNTGTVTNIGLLAGCRFKYKKLGIELAVGRGIGNSSYDYPDNTNYIPPSLSYGSFLQDVEKFYRAEFSIGYFFEKQEESPTDFYRNGQY